MAYKKHNDTIALKAIHEKMSDAEKETLVLFLKAFNKKYGDYQPKTLRLLYYISDITDEKELEFNTVKNHLFPEMSDAAFIKLASRLRDKMLESTMLDVNLDREGGLPASWVAKQKVRKKLGMIEMMLVKSNYFEAKHLIAKTKRECIQFELLDSFMSLLNLEYIVTSITEGSEKAENLAKETRKIADLSRFKLEVEQLFYKYNYRAQGSDISNSEMQLMISEIRKIASDERLKYSPMANYHLLHLKMKLAEMQGSFTSIYDVSNILMRLMDSHAHLSQPVRRTNLHLQQFTAAMHLRLFSEALVNVESAASYMKGESVAAMEVKLQRFYPLLHLAQYDKAIQVLNDAEIQAKTADVDLRRLNEKTTYLRAVVDFVRGDHTESSRKLSSITMITEESISWNIGLRVLAIQSRIAKQAFDAADTQIENLRRFLERKGKNRKLNQREVIIIRILNRMSKSNYEVKNFPPGMLEMLKLLEDSRLGYRWNPFGPEVIPFQDWANQWMTSKGFANKAMPSRQKNN
jgi:hypothetical protein